MCLSTVGNNTIYTLVGFVTYVGHLHIMEVCTELRTMRFEGCRFSPVHGPAGLSAHPGHVGLYSASSYLHDIKLLHFS